MTVKELKEILNTVDDNLPVIVSYVVNDEYAGSVPIKKENVEVVEVGNWITDGQDKIRKFYLTLEEYPSLCINFEA